MKDGSTSMLTRSFLLSSALFLLALASAGNAEARRLRFFIGVSRATSAPVPVMSRPAPTGAPGGASFAGAASRTGGPADGLPIVVPLPRPTDERRSRDEADAKATSESQPPVTEKRRGPASGFEAVSAERASTRGFETLSLR
jgi:hypothetical protein